VVAETPHMMCRTVQHLNRAIGIEKRGQRVGFLTPYRQYMQVIQIILGVSLTVAILLQARGAGLGSVFGGTGTVFKTRRGIDKVLFRMTIGLAVAFCLVSTVGAAIPA
jgi:preprotein translocase subunit SecG